MSSTSVELDDVTLLQHIHHYYLSTFVSSKIFGPQETITNGNTFDGTEEAVHIQELELS